MNVRKILMSCIAAMVVGSAWAEDTNSVDKSQYSLLNPTPDRYMRPLASDRADRITGPFTVDAGHFQIECDAVNYYKHQQKWEYPYEHVTRTATEFNWSPRFTVGLLDGVDFETQFNYETKENKYDYSGSYNATVKNHDDGFGFVSPMCKINLWGNNGGVTALSIMPQLSIPTDSRYDVNGGVALPFAVRLPEKFTLKITSWFESAQNSNKELFAGFENELSLTRAMTSKLNLFANLNTITTTDSNQEWYGYAGFGGAYTLMSNLQIYTGLRFGLTSNSYDYNPYLGLTWRF